MVLHQGRYALLLRPCKARRPTPPQAARRRPTRRPATAPRHPTIPRAPPPGPWVHTQAGREGTCDRVRRAQLGHYQERGESRVLHVSRARRLRRTHKPRDAKKQRCAQPPTRAPSILLADGPTSDSTTSDAMRSRICQCGRRRAIKPSPDTGMREGAAQASSEGSRRGNLLHLDQEFLVSFLVRRLFLLTYTACVLLNTVLGGREGGKSGEDAREDATRNDASPSAKRRSDLLYSPVTILLPRPHLLASETKARG
jgi:hypothetical protein